MLGNLYRCPTGIVKLHRFGNLCGSETVTPLLDAFALEVGCGRTHIDPELRRNVCERASGLVRSDELGDLITAQTDLCLFWALP